MILYGEGTENSELGRAYINNGLHRALDKLGKRKKVLVIPPDFTRFHSRAGEITTLIHDYYGENLKDILPALGTHSPMTTSQISEMFPGIPASLFREHNFRNDTVSLGAVPQEYISEISGGRLKFSWPVEVNKLVAEGGHDLIISVGQVVPHEVIGMAGYNKNILIGTGGQGSINLSHFLGAVCGMETIMGRANNPVRKLLNTAGSMFLSDLPIIYVLTVIGRNEAGNLVTRGLFIGDGTDLFTLASGLSFKVNVNMVGRPVKKAVVWLDPAEYKSTWLGNKGIYRTRMALADGAELIIMAPGVKEFGEDKEIDRLIRKYGYFGTAKTLDAFGKNSDLAECPAAAAHLIHGSSEGRFNVTYCPGGVSEKEIKKVGYGFNKLEEIMKKYNPGQLREGINILKGGEEIFFIGNPATGLWISSERFNYS